MLSGRYDFEDGGYYCGQYNEGIIEGYGVCISPKGQGEFSGKWLKGFEISGVYKWPSGKTYEGCWSENKKHGLGIERKDKWIYKGEWTRGLIGRYGCKCSQSSSACYEGTWSAGLVDGYGVEVSADGGIYKGQWFKGMRHGHGVRISVPYNQATHYRQSKSFQQNIKSSLSSLHSDIDESRSDFERGGFVLRGLASRTNTESDSSNLSGNLTPETSRKNVFKKKIGSSFKRSLVKKFGKHKRSEKGDSNSTSRSLPPSNSGSPVRYTSGSVRSLMSADSNKSSITDRTGSQVSFENHERKLVETYAGEWKSDKRCGYGIAIRSDGLKYAGEWYNNKKNGYGMTTSEDGLMEEGKYKNNGLVAAISARKASIFAIRSARLRDQVDNALLEAEKASQIAFQKTEVAVSRMKVARSKAELASEAAEQARKDSQVAFQIASKSWDDIIQDSDLGDSIQLRHSLVECEKKDQPAKEPITSSLIKQVFNSSFRKSLRLSQRSNKHSEKSHETQNVATCDVTNIMTTCEHFTNLKPSPDDKYAHTSTMTSNHQLPMEDHPIQNVSQEDDQYMTSSKDCEAYNFNRVVNRSTKTTNISQPTKSSKNSKMPSIKMELPLKSSNIGDIKSNNKTKESLSSWCLLMFFNIFIAVSILILLHRILV